MNNLSSLDHEVLKNSWQQYVESLRQAQATFEEVITRLNTRIYQIPLSAKITIHSIDEINMQPTAWERIAEEAEAIAHAELTRQFCCKYNARSFHLKCAVNPTGDCSTCFDFEDNSSEQAIQRFHPDLQNFVRGQIER